MKYTAFIRIKVKLKAFERLSHGIGVKDIFISVYLSLIIDCYVNDAILSYSYMISLGATDLMGDTHTGGHFEVIIGLAVMLPDVTFLHEGALSALLSIVLQDLVLVTSLGLILNDELTLTLGSLGIGHEVIITVRAELVGFLELIDLLAEHLSAFLADEDHFCGFFELVILGFFVALGAVEPLSAAGGSNGDLGVEDVLAHI